jgi:hypothetical protein
MVMPKPEDGLLTKVRRFLSGLRRSDGGGGGVMRWASTTTVIPDSFRDPSSTRLAALMLQTDLEKER